MTTFRRFVACVFVLLSVAGLVLGIVGGVGVWAVQRSVTQALRGIFDRIGSGLDIARENLDQVKVSLSRAQVRLGEVREEQRRLAPSPQGGPNLRRMMARSVSQFIAPELGDAKEKLYAVAKASVVVNSILEDVGNFPLLSVAGLDVDELSTMNEQLASVGPTAFELSRLLAEPNSDAALAGVQISRIEQILVSLQAWVGKYEGMVSDVRLRTDALAARTLPWIATVACVVSLASFWIAASQVGMLIHARSLWRAARPMAAP